MTFYVSGIIQQNIINIGNANTMWTHLQETYGTPRAIGIYVEFKCAINLRIHKNEDPMPHVNELRTIFSYLATNGLTLPDNAQAMMLLSALPHEWEGFASTLLTTLPATAPAGTAAGTPFLNFSMVLPKIQEEWSHCSGRSIMPKQTNESVKREQNAQTGLLVLTAKNALIVITPVITGMIINVLMSLSTSSWSISTEEFWESAKERKRKGERRTEEETEKCC